MTVLIGAGPLTELLADPEVTDVLVNGVQVWVDRGSGPVRAPLTMGSPEQTRQLAQRLASAGGRRLDDGCPFVDTRLADGSRVHAVLPPVAVSGPYLSVRTFRMRSRPLADLVGEPLAGLLAAIVEARLSVLISGGTGSGKTTLLNSLLALVPSRERIVIVEDAAELCPDHPHVVGLQARESNVEGAGAVRLADLVRQALRMRPDRLIVGECRGAETVELLSALNTGHDGGASTIHANTSADVPARLEALGLFGGVPAEALRAQISAAFQVVLQLRRTPTGRRLEEVCLLRRSGPGGVVTVWPVWQHKTGPGPAVNAFHRLLSDRGVPTPAIPGPLADHVALSPVLAPLLDSGYPPGFQELPSDRTATPNASGPLAGDAAASGVAVPTSDHRAGSAVASSAAGRAAASGVPVPSSDRGAGSGVAGPVADDAVVLGVPVLADLGAAAVGHGGVQALLELVEPVLPGGDAVRDVSAGPPPLPRRRSAMRADRVLSAVLDQL